MERERDGEGDSEREQRDHEPSAQLPEMLDERRLLAVAKTARQLHGYGVVVEVVSCSRASWG